MCQSERGGLLESLVKLRVAAISRSYGPRNGIWAHPILFCALLLPAEKDAPIFEKNAVVNFKFEIHSDIF